MVRVRYAVIERSECSNGFSFFAEIPHGQRKHSQSAGQQPCDAFRESDPFKPNQCGYAKLALEVMSG